MNLQPVISTLRLYHRYGKVERVGVPSLPVEIVDYIEKYLMEEERFALRETWRAHLTCWERRCKPTDHINEERRRKLYEDDMFLYAGSDEETGAENVPSNVLNNAQLSRLNNVLLGYSDLWLDKCRMNRRQWQEKVGSQTERDRGFFSQYSDLIAKHLGLKTWVSHTQRERRNGLVLRSENIYTTTVAYLTLSDSKKLRKDLHRCSYDGDDFGDQTPPDLSTETTWDISVELPNQVSERTVARFRRAMKVLELERYNKKMNHKTLFVQKGAIKDYDRDDHTTSLAQDTRRDGSRPELKLLIRNDDVPEEW